MKVEINKDGMLRISAGTELEAYALDKWLKDNYDGCQGFIKGDNIFFDWSLKPPFDISTKDKK